MAETADQEIKPYRIHISPSAKLELTRLPHEVVRPDLAQDDSLRERDGENDRLESRWRDGAPKSEIEPLVDYWLEAYSWREREQKYNEDWPQFRTAIEIETGEGEEVSPRVHFLHIKSPHVHAIPLLLVPSFPLTNLSLERLFSALTHPLNPTTNTPFHLVVPSIPGLGFSDPLGAHASVTPLKHTATLFNTLMTRLGYEFYLATATGSGSLSPANIDYHLLRLIGERYSKSCLGIHIIDPPFARPLPSRQLLAWGKFAIARFFHANFWGYESEDFAALRRSEKAARERKQSLSPNDRNVTAKQRSVRGGTGWVLGLREPDTWAYALCDSPVGMLSMTCSELRARNPTHALEHKDIVHVAQLAWLPGPEAGMRFWARAEKEVVILRRELGKGRRDGKKPRALVTVSGDGGGNGDGYVCSAWGEDELQVVGTRRASGGLGMVAWEKVDLVVEGVMALMKALKKDSRLLRLHVDSTVGFGGEQEATPTGPRTGATAGNEGNDVPVER